MTKEVRLYNEGTVISSIKAAGKTGQLHVKKMKLEHYLTPFKKIKNPQNGLRTYARWDTKKLLQRKTWT